MGVAARFGYDAKVIRRAQCTAAEAVGDLVCIADDPPNGYHVVAKADPSDYDKMPVVGVIISKQSPTMCLVQWTGETPDLFTGLASGEIYFLGADSKLAEVPPVPTTVPLFTQPVAVATAPTRVFVRPENNLTLRIP